MHIYFIGIGGAGIGPLALIASQAGYTVTGSDNKESEYTKYLRDKGLTVHIDQTGDAISEVHANLPIDWIVSTSAVVRISTDHPEVVFAKTHSIKLTERDALLNEIISSKNLKMIAAAGTHGKTTTAAMFVWVMKQLCIPISYSVGAKMSYADMGHYDDKSEYIVYECDEFQRNFLQFSPHMSLITGVTWDHHEVFLTQQDYIDAFREFIGQTNKTIVYEREKDFMKLADNPNIKILQHTDELYMALTIAGHYNRENARLVIEGVHAVTDVPYDDLVAIINTYPGIQRRMEEIAPNIFSDYAHTPEKIKGCMSVALETAKERGLDIYVIYEPLTNRRQHYMKEQYKDCFDGAKHIYWIPSYLAREDPTQTILSPEELITYLPESSAASVTSVDEELKNIVDTCIQNNGIVVAMTGGGGNSLDSWLRVHYSPKTASVNASGL